MPSRGLHQVRSNGYSLLGSVAQDVISVSLRSRLQLRLLELCGKPERLDFISLQGPNAQTDSIIEARQYRLLHGAGTWS